MVLNVEISDYVGFVMDRMRSSLTCDGFLAEVGSATSFVAWLPSFSAVFAPVCPIHNFM